MDHLFSQTKCSILKSKYIFIYSSIISIFEKNTISYMEISGRFDDYISHFMSLKKKKVSTYF